MHAHAVYAAHVGIPGIPRARLGNLSWLVSGGLEAHPELADAGRLAGWLLRRAVTAARAQAGAPVRRALLTHLGPGAAGWPVVTASWPAYDHVNVQVGLDAWLAAPGRRHELLGLTGFRHRKFGLADLTGARPRGPQAPPGVGSVTTEARPAGPGGATRACVTCGVYLVADGAARYALLLRGPDGSDPQETVELQVTGVDQGQVEEVLGEVRRLAVHCNVYRGQVISFGAEVFGPAGGCLLGFLDRPRLDRAEVILPPDLLDGIERQVLGIARYAASLLASGQHLKRGVLLHGPPGTGKTHTVRYLLGQMPGVTAIVISGAALRRISEACSIARALQPSVIVLEDVDLIAEPRGPQPSQPSPLSQLLNEMDGLTSDADVTFLLTTHRPDVLEEALAARPGRVDHTARLPLPDAAARRRLLRLYQGNLRISRATAAAVVDRTDGVTASFIKELLRRAALHAAVGTNGKLTRSPPAAGTLTATTLRVTSRHLNRALDELLDSRNQLTGLLLGGRAARGADAIIRPVLPRLHPTR